MESVDAHIILRQASTSPNRACTPQKPFEPVMSKAFSSNPQRKSSFEIGAALCATGNYQYSK